ncbi:MAG TPA: response regulator [Xanthobacteraceae bacterium]|nr:response regulator [Xanthobacteraceae bacterium]
MARILVADDEEALRWLLQRGLAHAGHEVAVAADGAEALDRLAAAEPRFDLLLSDIRMPVMDGIALALAAARDFPNLTILLMTGYSDHHERAQNLDALIAGIVPKPFSLAAIAAHVADALERSPLRSP